MAGAKRKTFLGVCAVMLSVVVLTGCTTGCADDSESQALGPGETDAVASSESSCQGPGPDFLHAWEDLIEAVFG